MASGVHVWTTNSSTNRTVDSAINWAEGMPPSGVNDSGGAMMTKVAEYRKDNAGTLTTAGTTTAYTIASPNATYASLAELDGVSLKVRFNATNGAAPTLNVASLGAKAIQTASGTAVTTGAILADSVHDLTYDNSIPAWLLSGAFKGAWAYTGNVTVGGTLGVTGALDATGNLAVNTNKFTVAAASGNTLVAGTLAVTGAATLSSTLAAGATTVTGALAASGDFAINTNKFTVASASGNALVAGTLAVTGAQTNTGALTANNAAGIAGRNTCKCFGKVVAGVLQAGSFNVNGIADGGNYHTIVFGTDLSSANYTVMVAGKGNPATTTWSYSDEDAHAFRIYSGGADPTSYSFAVFLND